MKFRRSLGLQALLWVVSADPALAQVATSEPTITVTGKRAEQAEVAANQAKEITLKPSGDVPLSHYYSPLCIKVFGIDAAYADLMAERIRENAAQLGLPVGKSGCQPNVWIGFVIDSKGEVGRLRQREPAMFAELKSFEIDRIFGGSGAAQVWHATEIRSLDGRPMAEMELDVPGPFSSARKIRVKVNQQYQGGRLVSPIRSDINGTIVVFDSARANGKTVQQLADYATFRILAPVQDYDKVPERALPTILTLFTPGGDPPGGLTEFDWAYLSAYYKLDRGAKASAVHDAARQAVLDGTGQTLSEKAAGD